jgi:hypothetical protein
VAVVLSSSARRGATQLRLITTGRRRLTVGPADFDVVPERVGAVELPSPYAPNNAAFQREVASRLGRARLGRRNGGHAPAEDPEVASLEAAVEASPVGRCPDLPRHRRALAARERLERERDNLRRTVKGRSASLARVGPHRRGRPARAALPRDRPAPGRGGPRRPVRRAGPG